MADDDLTYRTEDEIRAMGEFGAPGDARALAAEVIRLRGILSECWEAAELHGWNMPAQPYRAWEKPAELLEQIKDLARRPSGED